jgi:hypothetical protein
MEGGECEWEADYLYILIVERHYSLLRTVLKDTKVGEWGVNPNKNTPLGVAINRNDLIAAAILLENGADPNEETGSGFPLIIAAQKLSAAMMKLLLDFGANYTLAVYERGPWREHAMGTVLATRGLSSQRNTCVDVILESKLPPCFYTEYLMKSAMEVEVAVKLAAAGASTLNADIFFGPGDYIRIVNAATTTQTLASIAFKQYNYDMHAYARLTAHDEKTRKRKKIKF